MIAEALEAAGMLDRLVTRSVLTSGELKWARRFGLPSRWRQRGTSPVSRERLHRIPIADVAHRLGRASLHSEIRATDASFALVDRRAAGLVRQETRAVFGREDACLNAFRRAGDRGITTIYQLPTAHCATVRELVQREAAAFPEAFDQKEILLDFAPDRMERKKKELESARYILCPSVFVQRSVLAAGVPAERITTIPLGIESRWTSAANSTRQNVFLYVGNISARKGVHRLLRTWKRMGAQRTHTLRLIGDLNLPRRFLAEHKSVFEHIPRMPREQLISQYNTAAAFVFNAMADGFGHVFGEAMACSTPVLCSRNCGAPDLVTDGVEGRLFDYGEEDQLATVLDWALSHPTELREMGARGRQRAASWGWMEFGDAFLRWLRPVIS